MKRDACINAVQKASIETAPKLFANGRGQAFILYEEAIPDSNAERSALQSIVGALQRTRVFSPESRDSLVHKATGYSAKLLKKVDQCRAVCACSHLFWQDADEVTALPPQPSTMCPFCKRRSEKEGHAEKRSPKISCTYCWSETVAGLTESSNQEEIKTVGWTIMKLRFRTLHRHARVH